MKAIFIRLGESTGNAGIPSHDLATIELTERGQEQARAAAASWTEPQREFGLDGLAGPNAAGDQVAFSSSQAVERFQCRFY